jgi:hypothetical protein
MATRLTNDIRDSIVAKLMKHRFGDAIDTLIKDRAAFAEKIYNDVYPETQRHRMASLPAGWLPEDSDLSVEFNGQARGYTRLPFDGSFYGPMARFRSKVERVHRRILNKHDHSACAKSYDATHALAVEYGQLSDRFDSLKAEFETAERKASAALASVTTIKRLIETWPEIEPFAKEFDETPPKLPAIPTSDLNQLLDLPVDEAA